MIKVLQISGGDAGTLAGCLYITLLHLQLAFAAEISDEEGKSLWHELANSLEVVRESDRDKFLDLCLRRRVICDGEKFVGPEPTFHWQSNSVTEAQKERFWHTYACAFNRDLGQCPVDGAWTTWSPWSECSATCDVKGKQSRRRTCSNPVPVRGGNKCKGSMMRSRPCVGLCQTDLMPPAAENDMTGQEEARAYLDQVHASFPQLQRDCFETHCTFNTVERTIHHKHIRDKYWSSLSCVKYGGACPVDGEWSAWGTWSPCSLHCGAGIRTRTRQCDQPAPAYGGHACKGLWQEQDSCVGRDCSSSTSETFAEWTQWSPCSETCGTYGLQTSTRVCLRTLGCDLEGVLTPYVNRSKPCYRGACPQAGGWSDWSEWSDCAALCGTGRQSRMRLCDSPYPTGGLSCFGDTLEFRLCDGAACSGQTLPAEEETKGEANVPPGGGESVVLGGNDEYAILPLNKALESLYTPWSLWSQCTVSCGVDGTRVRSRSCSPQTTPMPPCEGEVRQVQFCNIFVCPVPGGWSEWMPWTPCSKTCEEGERFRYRACNSPLPQFGGSCAGDSVRTEKCVMPACPQTIDGSWGTWTQWSTCSLSCGTGQRVRDRHREHPTFGSRKHKTVSDNPGDIIKEVVDCNTQPCPVHGSWAEWGEWSRCSTVCGIGTRARDRTCTDPAPSFGGKACAGPGTDITHCFSGPCRDMEDRAIQLSSHSWVRYSPRNRPARFLALYLHFKPTQPDGFILHRYRQCQSVFDENEEDASDVDGDGKDDKWANEDSRCQLVVDLKLHDAKVVLEVQARGATLHITSNATLMLGAWHEVLVEVLRSGASLRINDQRRRNATFSRPLIRDLDFDSYMIIGAVDNTTQLGFEGSICMLSINFRPQDLFASTDWEGQGTPVSRHAVSAENINPSVQLPHFRGLYYTGLFLPHTQRLAIRLTMWLDEGDGLILYSRGKGGGSHLSLGVRSSRLVVCLKCAVTVRTSCHHADVLKLHQWYHMSLTVDQLEAEVRVDQSQAAQLTCKGDPFHPDQVVYLGGRGIPGWGAMQKTTNYTRGFYGTVGTAVLNGRVVSFRHAALLGRDNRLNPDGYSRALRITPVFEHKTSVVTLHCEIGQAMESDQQIKVIWLFSDSVLEPNESVEIIHPVGGDKQVGTLRLHPGGHREGLYGCLVSKDGRLVLSHVFPVFRHVPRPETSEGKMEWIALMLLLIVLPLLGLICFLLAKFWPWKTDRPPPPSSVRLVAMRGAYEHRKIDVPPPKMDVPPPKIDVPPPKFDVPPPSDDASSLELCLPHRRRMHNPDDTSQFQQHLEDDDYTLHRLKVQSFGPPEPRVIKVTPGTASQRIALPHDGSMKMGYVNRNNISLSYLPGPGEDQFVSDRNADLPDAEGFRKASQRRRITTRMSMIPTDTTSITQFKQHMHAKQGQDHQWLSSDDASRKCVSYLEPMYDNMQRNCQEPTYENYERTYQNYQGNNQYYQGNLLDYQGNNKDNHGHYFQAENAQQRQQQEGVRDVLERNTPCQSDISQNFSRSSKQEEWQSPGRNDSSRSRSRGRSRSRSRSNSRGRPGEDGTYCRSRRQLRWSDDVDPPRLPPPPPPPPKTNSLPPSAQPVRQARPSPTRLPSGKYLPPGTPPPPPPPTSE